MARNRRFLFGLGTGIMIGAILVQLSHIGEAASPSLQPSASPSSAPAPVVWTEEELTKAAEEKGKVVISKDDFEKWKQTPTPAPATSTPALVPTKRFLYVYSGMNSTAVVEYLYQAGVVQDRYVFQEKLRKQGLTKKLVAGLYSFELNSDIDQVVAELTGANR
ncbi:hypothetical protein [Gorillibacterium sp. CAU 1737]|uniref:hypothetical protein n=1 Tax=Gorillibacterium sp. CAU 1737 TaxID=3140362 RepID=UPI003261060E